jgi:hypothetical protein
LELSSSAALPSITARYSIPDIMAEAVVTNQQSAPQWTGLRYLHEDPELSNSVMLNYSYNGSQFSVLTSADDTSQGSGLGQSDEGKILNELNDLSWGEVCKEKDIRIEALEDKLAGLVGDACFPLMRELSPLSTPEPRTLQERIYPLTYALRVFAEDRRLASQELVKFELPAKYPPIAEAKLREIGLDDTLPVFDPSQIILGPRLQALVWKVTVDGEDMICKVAIDIFGQSVCEELETYLKIRRAGITDGLRVPELKCTPIQFHVVTFWANTVSGIIRSHTGVIGILLSYIPHKYHNLRVLLELLEQGAVLETEATASLKLKWAQQIHHSLARLHKLGILWRDVKSDNILIDENNDAVLLDFGGGNTVGWVDHDKYGTMKGEQQGLQRIMKALGEE